jgi:hypothetical protein
MYTFPAESTASPDGRFSSAPVAGPPSLAAAIPVPLPALVEMSAVDALTSRTRSFH